MSKAEEVMRSAAQRALEGADNVNCEGFEASKVFALTKQMIEHPPPGSTINRKRLLRRVNAILLFVVHPSQPLDPSNPRTKPTKLQSGGGIRPAYWYMDFRKTATLGKGQPPKTLLGRRRKADVIIECMDRDLVDIATGRSFATKIYNNGRIKIKGSIDTALVVAELLTHERSQLYGTVDPQPPTASNLGDTSMEAHAYSEGSPAPITTDVVKSRL